MAVTYETILFRLLFKYVFLYSFPSDKQVGDTQQSATTLAPVDMQQAHAAAAATINTEYNQ